MTCCWQTAITGAKPPTASTMLPSSSEDLTWQTNQVISVFNLRCWWEVDQGGRVKWVSSRFCFVFWDIWVTLSWTCSVSKRRITYLTDDISCTAGDGYRQHGGPEPSAQCYCPWVRCVSKMCTGHSLAVTIIAKLVSVAATAPPHAGNHERASKRPHKWRQQLLVFLKSITYSFTIVKLHAKSLLFASRQKTPNPPFVPIHPILNVPFRTLTPNNPSLYATTSPDVWLGLSLLLYFLTGPWPDWKARVEQRDYRCHYHRGRQAVTRSKGILLPLKTGVLSYSNEATSTQTRDLDKTWWGDLSAVMGDVAALV